MTPVLLLLAAPRRGEEEVALAPSSYLSADGVLDVAPYPQLRSRLRGEDVGRGLAGPPGYKGTL